MRSASSTSEEAQIKKGCGSRRAVALTVVCLTVVVGLPIIAGRAKPIVTASNSMPQAVPITPQAIVDDPAGDPEPAKLAGFLGQHFTVPEERASLIVREAFRYAAADDRLRPELLLAVMAVESSFRERAMSHAGARGLMQIRPVAHPHAVRKIGGAHALFDPRKNISLGTQILRDCLDRSAGDLREALLRYNGSWSRRGSRYPERVMAVFRRMTEADGLASRDATQG